MWQEIEDKRPFDTPIVILDTETTGLKAGLGHRVVEIGAVRWENGQVVGEFEQLLNPQRKMESQASEVTQIFDQDLAEAPVFADIQASFLAFIEGAVLVAHNAEFDAGFISTELFISGYATEPQKIPLLNPWLCTWQLARNQFHFGSNSLANVTRALNVPPMRAHRALNDVYMTAEVFRRMVTQLAQQNLHTVGDLIVAQGAEIYTPPPPDVLLLPPMDEALQNGRSLHIRYLSRDHGETERDITPRYTTRYRGEPYLVAYCHLRDAQRAFRLDRIYHAELVQ